MGLLIWFQTIGNDFLDILFKIFTLMGEEYFIMVIFCYLAWCGNKEFAHKTGFAFCFGMGINQILKLVFCIQRPWILDNRIKPSPYALESATGYSFPSGHTQSGVTVFGCLSKKFGRVALKIFFIFCAVGVGVSRLYFNVHTPQDVAVSFLIGIIVIFATEYIYKFCEGHNKITLVLGLLISVGMVFYAILKPYPPYHLPEYTYDCVKIAGAIGGFIFGWFLERNYIKYQTGNNTIFNVIKTIIGIALLLVIKLVLKKTLPENYVFMYLENFMLIFWCITAYPYLLTKAQIR